MECPHVCAIDSQDRALCWGRNNFGQLGTGLILDSSVSTLVSGLTTVKQISAGIEFSCAINLQGNAFCWGSNANGQLGDNSIGQFGNNSTVSSNIPVQVR